MIDKVDRALIRLTALAVVALMLAMVASILAGVFFRYVLNAALPWPEELSRFAMVWLTMLGSGLVVRYGGHIAVLALLARLRGRSRAAVLWIGRVLVLAFLAFLVWFGADMTERVSRQRSAALEWSMSIPNLALPIGASLMIYHLAMVVFRREDADGRPPPIPFGR